MKERKTKKGREKQESKSRMKNRWKTNSKDLEGLQSDTDDQSIEVAFTMGNQ